MIDNQVSPLLPEKLQQLLNSHAPGNHVTTALNEVCSLINVSETELVSSWLSSSEHEEFNRYSFQKRRSEWLSGRICAKQAVLNLLKSNSDYKQLRPIDITIAVNSSGRPFCKIHNQEHPVPGVDLSISHSNGKAVSVAGQGLCGVDIQHLNDTLFRVKDRYCTPIEAAILDNVSVEELLQLGMLWVAKEAVRKCLSEIKLIGFLDMHLERIGTEAGYHVLHFKLDEPLLSEGALSAITHIHDSHALAVCTVDRVRLNA